MSSVLVELNLIAVKESQSPSEKDTLINEAAWFMKVGKNKLMSEYHQETMFLYTRMVLRLSLFVH